MCPAPHCRYGKRQACARKSRVPEPPRRRGAHPARPRAPRHPPGPRQPTLVQATRAPAARAPRPRTAPEHRRPAPDGIRVLLVANPTCERSEHVTFWLRARWREAPPSELRRGSGGAAPSGVQGQSPWWGARGAKPPGKILRKKGYFEQFWNINLQ